MPLAVAYSLKKVFSGSAISASRNETKKTPSRSVALVFVRLYVSVRSLASPDRTEEKAMESPAGALPPDSCVPLD